MEKKNLIEEISLEEIHYDYMTIRAMQDKYYYTTAAEGLRNGMEGVLAVLKDEIVKRKIEELTETYIEQTGQNDATMLVDVNPTWTQSQTESSTKPLYNTTVTDECIKVGGYSLAE